jgi:hypothetical protein
VLHRKPPIDDLALEVAIDEVAVVDGNPRTMSMALTPPDQKRGV